MPNDFLQQMAALGNELRQYREMSAAANPYLTPSSFIPAGLGNIGRISGMGLDWVWEQGAQSGMLPRMLQASGNAGVTHRHRQQHLAYQQMVEYQQRQNHQVLQSTLQNTFGMGETASGHAATGIAMLGQEGRLLAGGAMTDRGILALMNAVRSGDRFGMASQAETRGMQQAFDSYFGFTPGETVRLGRTGGYSRDELALGFDRLVSRRGRLVRDRQQRRVQDDISTLTASAIDRIDNGELKNFIRERVDDGDTLDQAARAAAREFGENVDIREVDQALAAAAREELGGRYEGATNIESMRRMAELDEGAVSDYLDSLSILGETADKFVEDLERVFGRQSATPEKLKAISTQLAALSDASGIAIETLQGFVTSASATSVGAGGRSLTVREALRATRAGAFAYGAARDLGMTDEDAAALSSRAGAAAAMIAGGPAMSLLTNLESYDAVGEAFGRLRSTGHLGGAALTEMLDRALTTDNLDSLMDELKLEGEARDQFREAVSITRGMALVGDDEKTRRLRQLAANQARVRAEALEASMEGMPEDQRREAQNVRNLYRRRVVENRLLEELGEEGVDSATEILRTAGVDEKTLRKMSDADRVTVATLFADAMSTGSVADAERHLHFELRRVLGEERYEEEVGDLDAAAVSVAATRDLVSLISSGEASVAAHMLSGLVDEDERRDELSRRGIMIGRTAQGATYNRLAQLAQEGGDLAGFFGDDLDNVIANIAGVTGIELTPERQAEADALRHAIAAMGDKEREAFDKATKDYMDAHSAFEVSGEDAEAARVREARDALSGLLGKHALDADALAAGLTHSRERGDQERNLEITGTLELTGEMAANLKARNRRDESGPPGSPGGAVELVEGAKNLLKGLTGRGR